MPVLRRFFDVTITVFGETKMKHLPGVMGGLFLLFCLIAGTEKGVSQEKPSPPQVVWLGYPEIQLSDLPGNYGWIDNLLAKRLSAMLIHVPREAFLIAARDELGVTTRDEMLFETCPDNAVAFPDVNKLLPIDINWKDPFRFYNLINEVEKYSRKVYVDILKKTASGMRFPIIRPFPTLNVPFRKKSTSSFAN